MDADLPFLSPGSRASKKLANIVHVELSDEMVELLSSDWLQYPQLRYCTSQSLAGAIIIEGAKSVIVNNIELYSRDTLLDAHHERRLSGTASSFPSTPNRYGFVTIRQLSAPDGLKLVIGSR
jgi:hypothetical protein